VEFERLMRNRDAPHIDYGAFLGLLPNNPKACPCNIDGIIERKGKFLVLEWKREGEGMSEGLRRTLQALAGTTGFQVWIVRGDTDNGLRIGRFYSVPPFGKPKLLGEGVDEFIAVYRLWYEYADGSF
jgi:hypothetical protein